jgi:hypothetical protein
MCFMLFAGTDRELTQGEWRKDAPDVWVRAVLGDEARIKTHFQKPVVQYVGSTAGCGCDFPHWILFNGKVPADGFDGRDDDQKASDHDNARRLERLLRESGERDIELYSVWAGNWSRSPIAVEEIKLEDIIAPTFLFGEQVFYRVKVS